MSDPFRHHARGLESPASQHFQITPSDGSDLPRRPRVLYCNVSGTAALRDETGALLSYTLIAGQILPLSPMRVEATGTTASLIGWW